MKRVLEIRFPTVILLIVAALTFIDRIWNLGVFISLVSIFESALSMETDHYLVPAVLVVIAFGVDWYLHHKKTARHIAEATEQAYIAEQRLQVLKATMRTVQDIVGNMQQGLLLFRLKFEDHWSEEDRKLFDDLIYHTAERLKSIANSESVTETQMANGAGVEYTEPISPAERQKFEESVSKFSLN